jgi:hypothetical protein
MVSRNADPKLADGLIKPCGDLIYAVVWRRAGNNNKEPISQESACSAWRFGMDMRAALCVTCDA